jgi:hypothetical protein
MVERSILNEPRKANFIFAYLSIKCNRVARTDAFLKVNGTSSSTNIQVTVQAISVDISVLRNTDENSNYLLII